MPFEPGNKEAAKSKQFLGALQRAITQEDGKRLRQAADKLLDLAAEGEAWAVKELADRLDGKPTQQVDATLANPDGTSIFARAVLELVAVDQRAT
jgi:hypothetical protein